MNKVLLISGPPCSGKTHLINQISQNINTTFKKNLGSCYDIINANQIRNGVSYTNKTLLIHYDCFRSYKRKLKPSINTDKFLLFLSQQQHIEILYILNPLKVLKSRMQERYNRLKKTISATRIAKLKSMLDLYENEIKFNEEYLKWYEFSTQLCPINQFVAYNSLPNVKDNLIKPLEKNCFSKILDQNETNS